MKFFDLIPVFLWTSQFFKSNNEIVFMVIMRVLLVHDAHLVLLSMKLVMSSP